MPATFEYPVGGTIHFHELLPLFLSLFENPRNLGFLPVYTEKHPTMFNTPQDTFL
jgi:hypothetical protein